VEQSLGGPLEEDPTIRLVREVAPNKSMLCISFRLPAAVARAQQPSLSQGASPPLEPAAATQQSALEVQPDSSSVGADAAADLEADVMKSDMAATQAQNSAADPPQLHNESSEAAIPDSRKVPQKLSEAHPTIPSAPHSARASSDLSDASDTKALSGLPPAKKLRTSP
jgi:hypothetical protein